MRVGTTLPQFRHDAEPALATARRAEEAGLDGVFVFDHLWPLGQPDRPALHGPTLLGALAAETTRVTLGTLVARVGVVPDAVLVNTLRSAERIAGGRFVAGLGTGDGASRPETAAAGVVFPPAAERVERLRACACQLRAAGVRIWVGGRSRAVRQAAAEVADGWNAWGVTVEEFAEEAAIVPPPAPALASAAGGFELSWGGQVLIGSGPEEAAAKLSRHGHRRGLVSGTAEDLAVHLRRLAAAGAGWAICAPLDVGADPGAVDLLADAVRLFRAGPGGGSSP